MNVYIVTQGEYSSYHIVAVFRNREAAEAYADQYVSKHYWPAEVETFEVEDWPATKQDPPATGRQEA